MPISDDFSHSFFLVFLCSGRVLYDKCAIFFIKKLNYFPCKKQHVDWLVGDLPYLTLWNPSFVFGKWERGGGGGCGGGCGSSCLKGSWFIFSGGSRAQPLPSCRINERLGRVAAFEGPGGQLFFPQSLPQPLTQWSWLSSLESSFLLQASCARVVFQKTGRVKSMTHALLIWKTDEWKGNENFSSILWSKHFFFRNLILL